MVNAYTTYVTDVGYIRNKLKSMLGPGAGFTWLSGHVYKSDGGHVDGLPCVFITLREDNPEVKSYSDAKYDIYPGFDIVFRIARTGESASDYETDEDCLVSGVSAILGAIRYEMNRITDSNTISGDIKWTKIIIEHVDYKHQSPGITPGAIREAKIEVRAGLAWTKQ